MALTPQQLGTITTILRDNMQVFYKDTYDQDWSKDLIVTETVEKRNVTEAWMNDAGLVRQVPFNVPPTYEKLLGDRANFALRMYESAISVDMYDFVQSDIPRLQNKAKEIGANIGRLNRDLVIDLLATGDTAAYLMYDGQPYFANAHLKNGVTYDNLWTGLPTVANFQALRTVMRRFPSDFGLTRPLNITPKWMIVPPDLAYDSRLLQGSAVIPISNAFYDNPVKGMAEVYDDAMFTDVNDWYLIADTATVKPFICFMHSEFGNFSINSEVAQNSPSVRDNGEYRWWGRTCRLVYPTHPYLAIKSVN